MAHTWFLCFYNQKQRTIDRVIERMRKAHPGIVRAERESYVLYGHQRVTIDLHFRDKASLEAFKNDHVMKALYTRHAVAGTRLSVKDLVVVPPRLVASVGAPV